MFRWSDVIAVEVRREEMRMQALCELQGAAASIPNRRPRFYQAIVFRFGGWLTSAGIRMQQRYAALVEPTCTSTIEPTQGAC